GGALEQAGPGGGLCGEPTGAFTQLGERVFQLLLREGGETRVERGLKFLRWPLPVLVDAFVAGGGHVAGLVSAQLPDDPFRGLDPAVGALIDIGSSRSTCRALANCHSEEIRPP